MDSQRDNREPAIDELLVELEAEIERIEALLHQRDAEPADKG